LSPNDKSRLHRIKPSNPFSQDELKYFIGAVTKQVIERHLVDTLPSTILSPMVIAGLSDDEIRFVAAEPSEVTQQRMHLEAKREMLEKGLATFRSAMGGPRF
jgi:CRISPR/Cas system-associated protein Csm6